MVINHKALLSLSTSKTLNRRLQGNALKLQGFDMDVVYKEGRWNGNAEGLLHQAWDSKEMVCAEKEEDDQRTLRTEIQISSGRCGDSSPQHITKEQCEHATRH